MIVTKGSGDDFSSLPGKFREIAPDQTLLTIFPEESTESLP
jgi:hypothetical protein